MSRPFSKPIIIVVTLGIIALLGGCQSGAAGPVLPTSTAVPTDIIPTATATFLPPPTVTPYPSPTMRGAGGEIIQLDAPPASSGETQSAGQEPSAPQATLPPAPTEPPPATPTLSFINLPQGVSLLSSVYTSDFNGWPAFNEPTAKSAYSNGKYHIEIGPFDGRFFNTTALNAGNTYTQLNVSPETCPQKSGYGLMFHFKDASNYYLLTIFCDNTYTAVAKIAGSVVALNYGDLPSGVDATSSETHHLGVLAHGNDYTLYIEGQPIGSFADAQFPKGDVAIYAVSQGAKVLKVNFESLKVWTVQ